MVQALEERLSLGESLDDITIEALSERAGVASGSFYEYFVNKDSVLGLLVGKITQRNFTELSNQLESLKEPTLDGHVDAFSEIVVRTYFSRPRRLRAEVLGIGRLGLLEIVTLERDRFAELMAKSVKPYLPSADDRELFRTLCLVADATMGILGSEALRPHPAALTQLVNEIATITRAILRSRHSGVIEARLSPD